MADLKLMVNVKGFGSAKVFCTAGWKYSWLWTKPYAYDPHILLWDTLEIYTSNSSICAMQKIKGDIELGTYTHLNRLGWTVPMWCDTIVVRSGNEVMNDLDYWRKISSMA